MAPDGMVSRPLIVPSDFTGIGQVLTLHNGDEPIIIILSKSGVTYIVLRTIEVTYSCLWNDQMCPAESYLAPINKEFLWLTFAAIRLSSHLPMDTLDSWRMALEQCGYDSPSSPFLPGGSIVESFEKLSEEEALKLLVKSIEERSKKASQVPLYKTWQESINLQGRWQQNSNNEQCFMIDLLSPILGTYLIGKLCDIMKLSLPQSITTPPPQAQCEGAGKRLPVKRTAKTTTTINHQKGHKSLTSFFKKITK